MLASTLVACAFILQAVSGQPRVPPPAGTATIRGRVIAADTGRPLRYVQVMLGPDFAEMGSDARLSRQTTTAADGSFEFEHLPAGRFTMFAGPMDAQSTYLPSVYGFDDEHPLGVAIELSEGQVFDKADIRLPRGGVIAGRVVDEFGRPLSNVSVTPVRFDAKGTPSPAGVRVESDDRGAFRLFGLQPGEWSVLASGALAVPQAAGDARAGFLDTYYPAEANAASAQRIAVGPGQEVGDVLLQMRYGRLFRISGLVLDPQGQPLADASVSLTSGQESSTTSISIDADGSGRFTFEHVAAGHFVISATPKTVGTPFHQVAPTPASFGKIDLTVGDRDINDVVLATSAGADVSGELVFDPEPPRGERPVDIFAEPQDHSTPTATAAVREDDRGALAFHLEHLIGKYRVEVPSLPSGSYLKSIIINGQIAADGPLQFKPGDRLTLIVSTRAAKVGGRVTRSDGRPAVRFVVFLVPVDAATYDVLRPAFTTADGQYTFDTVRPGSYRVIALDPADETDDQAGGPEAIARRRGIPVTVVEGDHAVVNVTVNGSGGLR